LDIQIQASLVPHPSYVKELVETTAPAVHWTFEARLYRQGKVMEKAMQLIAGCKGIVG
jgi:hypothetical protein